MPLAMFLPASVSRRADLTALLKLVREVVSVMMF